jgi:hypothetical protein
MGDQKGQEAWRERDAAERDVSVQLWVSWMKAEKKAYCYNARERREEREGKRRGEGRREEERKGEEEEEGGEGEERRENRRRRRERRGPEERRGERGQGEQQRLYSFSFWREDTPRSWSGEDPCLFWQNGERGVTAVCSRR